MRVLDIFAGAAASGPTPLAAAAFGMLFTADNGLVGRELLRTDGIGVATLLVKNLNVGAGSGIALGTVAAPVEWNDALYFAANDGATGVELWTSDGTEAGTVRLKDIRAGAAGSGPTLLTVFHDALYFIADDGVSGRELWKTDGTEAGTVLVKDLNPGAPSSGAATMMVFNGAFVPDRDQWRERHGTLENRRHRGGHGHVEGRQPGRSQFPGSLTAVGSALFFTASDPIAGQESGASPSMRPPAIVMNNEHGERAGPDKARHPA